MLEPTSAPIKVPMFQLAYKITLEIQNAVRCNCGSVSAETIAVVSSITHCAPSKRAGNELCFKTGDIAKPYTALRPDNNTAPPKALANVPPDAITLTADICDAPVKMSADIAHACNTLAPAEMASTPKEAPKITKATPIASEATMKRRASGARK